MRIPSLVFALLLTSSHVASAPLDACGPADVRTRARLRPSLHTGRYRAGDEVLYLASCGPDGVGADSVAVSPLPWAGIEYALRAHGDSFIVADRPHRTVVFERDVAGRVLAVRTNGFGIAARFARDDRTPPTLLEHLLFGSSADTAATALIRETATDPSVASTAIRLALTRHPSRMPFVVATLDRARAIAPTDSGLRALRGSVEEDVAPPDTGWRTPFAPESLLAPPTRAEVDAAWRAITSRRRVALEPIVLDRRIALFAGDSFLVRIVAHGPSGARHVGAVITPISPLPRCCGTIVEIRGTDPSYSPLSLERGVRALRMLGTAARAYAYVAPAIRGETIRFGGRDFTAEGDRTDGWDGGAEDALTLLAAASVLDARIDPARACTFGHSRGAAVALLAAERDPRIRCAIALAGPVDWFAAMWRPRRPAAATLRAALRAHARPQDEGGQFIERFVQPVLEGRWTLADARLRMLSSSPYYFAERLPATLAIFGAEDNAVPVQNAWLLEAALRRAGRDSVDAGVRIAPMAGHDTDPVLIVRLVPTFLSRSLGTPVGERRPGADAR